MTSSDNRHPEPDSHEPGAAGDKLGCGLAGLIFVFPLAGLALYVTEKKTRPGRAQGAARVALIGLVFGVILLGLLAVAVPLIDQNRQNPMRSLCQSHLKRLWTGTKEYAAAHGGKLPDLSTPQASGLELDPYTRDHAVLVCPQNDEWYQTNTALSKLRMKEVRNPAATILFYEEKATHYNGRNVCFANGKVTWLDEAAWQRAKQASGIR